MKKTKFIAAALAVLFVFNAYALPRSKAVVIDATAAFGAAAATAAINGTTATTLFTGMSTSAATTAMTTLMGEYVSSTGVAASGTALAGTIGAGTIVTAAGALVLTAAAGYAVYKFIEWLREEKGLEAGGEKVSVDAFSGFTLADGTDISLYKGSDFETGYFFEANTLYTLMNGYSVQFIPGSSGMTCRVVSPTGSVAENSVGGSPWSGYSFYGGALSELNEDGRVYVAVKYYKPSVEAFRWITDSDDLSIGLPISETLELAPSPDFQTIPQEIPEGHVLKIDTGIESLSADDQQAAADAIMQTAIDGVFSPTVSVESDPTVTPDPDPDPTLPPDDLPPNLPQLGDVLTSRFPFSIPWDIGRVLDFLSAKPVAPHVEFQPFKGGLFGIPADSVSVDFDFSKYEDIASFCRTFEIVGFCLLLAVGTKRLIWTA